MKLTRSSLSITVNGRSVRIGGEAYLPGHGSPDFVVFSSSITKWEDGEDINDTEKAAIIRQISKEADEKGITVEFE